MGSNFSEPQSQETDFLLIIHQQYESNEWQKYNNELQRIVNDLLYNLKERKSNIFEAKRFNNLGLTTKKILVIEEQWKSYCNNYLSNQQGLQKSYHDRLNQKYGIYLQSQNKLCLTIEGLVDNALLLGDSPQKTIDYLVYLISKKDRNQISFFIKSKHLSSNSIMILDTFINKEYFDELQKSQLMQNNQDKEEIFFHLIKGLLPQQKQSQLNETFPLLLQALIAHNQESVYWYAAQLQIRNSFKEIEDKWNMLGRMNECILSNSELELLQFLIQQTRENKDIRISTLSFKYFLFRVKSTENEAEREDLIHKQLKAWKIFEEMKQQLIAQKLNSLIKGNQIVNQQQERGDSKVTKKYQPIFSELDIHKKRIEQKPEVKKIYDTPVIKIKQEEKNTFEVIKSESNHDDQRKYVEPQIKKKQEDYMMFHTQQTEKKQEQKKINDTPLIEQKQEEKRKYEDLQIKNKQQDYVMLHSQKTEKKQDRKNNDDYEIIKKKQEETKSFNSQQIEKQYQTQNKFGEPKVERKYEDKTIYYSQIIEKPNKDQQKSKELRNEKQQEDLSINYTEDIDEKQHTVKAADEIAKLNRLIKSKQEEFQLKIKDQSVIQKQQEFAYKKKDDRSVIQKQQEVQFKKKDEPVIQRQVELKREHQTYQQLELSQQFQILYQQDDQCLDQVTSKVIANTPQIVNMLSTLKTNQCKCIGFYGDFQVSYRILSQMFPKILPLDVKSYTHPLKDKIVGYSDGQNIFLIYQESTQSFEGDIYENDDGILYIRFLLDTCQVVILCLNEQNTLEWKDQNPFENFKSTEPPLIIKDRSCINIRSIKTTLLDRSLSYRIQSSLDNNNILYRWKEGETSMMSQYQEEIAIDKINKNYRYLKEFRNDFLYKKFDLNILDLISNKNQVSDIFMKSDHLRNYVQHFFNKLLSDFETLKKNSIIVEDNINLKIDMKDFFFYKVEHEVIQKQQQQIENDVFLKRLEELNLKEKNKELSILETTLLQLDKNDFICQSCFFERDNSCNKCNNLKIINNSFQHSYEERLLKNSKKYVNTWWFHERKTFTEMKRKDIVNLYFKNKKEFFEKLEDILLNESFKNRFDDEWLKLKRQINFQDNIPILSSKEKEVFPLFNSIIVEYSIKGFQEIISRQEKLAEGFTHIIDTYQASVLSCFDEYRKKKENRIMVSPLQINYNLIKNENCVGVVQNLRDIVLPDSAHSILQYIAFDDKIDYLVTCNSKDPVEKQKITIWTVERKKKVEYSQLFRIAYEIPGSGEDCTIHINPKSNQWVIFENRRKKQAIGRINGDYKFQEGKLSINIFNAKINGCLHQIERVDKCFFLNDIDNYFFISEKSKDMYYQVSLNGKIQLKDFKLQIEVDNKLQELSDQKITDVFNDPENEIYVFETQDSIKLANPNYIVKNEIKIDRKVYKGFKLIQTETDLLLVIINKSDFISYVITDNDNVKCFQEHSDSNNAEQKQGNVVIDKLIRAVQYYGQNFVDLGCPSPNYLLCYYENGQQTQNNNMNSRIKTYIDSCFEKLSLTYRLQNQQVDNSNIIKDIINRINQYLQISSSFKVSQLETLLLTRIPIQLTTIQQANYIPLQDGFFQQDFMNLRSTNESQIDSIKDKISFGWFEYILNKLTDKSLYVISMCGRQSVGKSSQLNRMFGTRFGVSAARCTDGVWLGYTIINGKQVLILDCEGLFSIRRTEDEEVKLLQQIILISDVSIILNDLEGVSQPLLDLFKKLQLCVGKKKGDGIYFQGALYFLTKNIQDNGDKRKIETELKGHLESNKSTKNMLQAICQGSIGYGYLKPFLSKEYDSILKDVRNTGIFGHFLDKSQKKFTSKQTLSYLKYSMVQIFLDDDTDIELVSKISEIKKDTQEYKQAFLNLTKKDIPEEKFEIKFNYKPSIKENERIVEGYYNLNDQSSSGTQQQRQERAEKTKIKQMKVHSGLIFNQVELKFDKEDDDAFQQNLKSMRRKTLQRFFEINYLMLSHVDHNNYHEQLQLFFNTVLEQRREVVTQYYESKLPRSFKFLELCNKYKLEFKTFVDQLVEEFQICKKQCNVCDRYCVSQKNHIGDCDCETSHNCTEECEICSKDEKKIRQKSELNLNQFNPFQCSLNSGHLGAHLCSTEQHLCGQKCQISSLCQATCNLTVNHDHSTKHNCQKKHQCTHQCRLYEKCKKSCKFQSDHEEDYHICDSEICFDKCVICGKQCQFPRHDHDHLIKDPDANREFLKKRIVNEDGSTVEVIVSDHLCGEAHICKSKCEKEGICKINYETEERIWVSPSTGSQFPYSFYKPIQSYNECTKQIPKWQKQHYEKHECDQQHRCDQHCPECLSFCTHDHNHEGNHVTSNHRNKEMCIFINESEGNIQIKDDEESHARQYKAGESAIPETCYLSCQRQGRAHYHLRECKSDEECASKLYPNQARHSDKIYFPYTEKRYDEILCKGYWNSIGWETPISVNKDLEKLVGLCNYACSNDVHTKDNMNYCIEKAWHINGHNIDASLCPHKGGRRSDQIDICFTIDSTGSMGFAFPEVKNAVKSIIDKFKDTALSLQFAIVCYRDHPPQDNSFGPSGVKIHNFVEQSQILTIVDSLTADGGGDTPENVLCALQKSCQELSWRKASEKFIFHICDSPPHGKEYGCSSSDPEWTSKGCPCGVKKEHVARCLDDNGILYYLIKCTTSLNMMESLFQGTFNSNFKEAIEIKKHSEINVAISESVFKEIKINNELYHIIPNA